MPDGLREEALCIVRTPYLEDPCTASQAHPAAPTSPCFHATRSYLERHGKPVAFYSDNAGVFRANAKRPKAGDGFTQFGRAMSDLNIDMICANTPAAKGRVERAHQTLQDRLVKELRLWGICATDEANACFPEFMDDYNRRFARAARIDHDAHRPLLERDCLDDIFTWQEERRVTAQLTELPDIWTTAPCPSRAPGYLDSVALPCRGYGYLDSGGARGGSAQHRAGERWRPRDLEAWSWISA